MGIMRTVYADFVRRLPNTYNTQVFLPSAMTVIAPDATIHINIKAVTIAVKSFPPTPIMSIVKSLFNHF